MLVYGKNYLDRKMIIMLASYSRVLLRARMEQQPCEDDLVVLVVVCVVIVVW